MAGTSRDCGDGLGQPQISGRAWSHPQSHVKLEVMETALAVGWGRGWEAELDSSQPLVLSPSHAGPCPPSRCHAWVPAGAPPSPVTTVTLGKQGCKERRGSPLDLHVPTPLQGAAGEPGEPSTPLPWTSGGILTRVSSLAGVPGAIPGGGVPGGAFFPGKGAQAPLGGGITLSAKMGRCLGGP